MAYGKRMKKNSMVIAVLAAIARYHRALLLLLFTVTALFIGISLISYHPTDPSWFLYTNAATTVTNWLGYAGACCAALLHYLWGSCAWGVWLLSIYGIWYLLAQPRFTQEWDRIAALISLLISASMLEYVIPRSHANSGLIGRTLVQTVQRWLDPMSIHIMLGFMLLATVTIITRAAYLYVLHKAVQGVAFLWQYRAVVLHPLYLITAYTMRAIGIVLNAGARWVSTLLFGTNVYDATESVFEADSGQSLDAATKQIHDDQFWQQYINTPTNSFEASVPDTPVQFNADTLGHALAAPVADTPEFINKQLETPSLQQFFKPRSGDDKKGTDDYDQQARLLEEKLRHFGVQGTVSAIKPGPVVTLFEYMPAIDTKLSRITALEDDLALALQAISIRIIAPIPGTAVVGFEVANKTRATVLFNHMVTATEFSMHQGSLPVILGKDTVGNSLVIDLVQMPHLLLAGSTGSGKSVALHTILISLLCRKRPDELRLLLIDPKRLEFSVYADIPHLLFPIVTQARDALPVLHWAVQEMEQRYTQMAEVGVRTINEYNARATATKEMKKLPYLVIIIDELADLMLTAGKQVEELIIRLSQMARAAGIHLVVATQRPSVDVVTGLIKANLPSRIALRVASKIDSRTILDSSGAEKLLGYGDMLYMPAGSSLALRVHGAYISHEECIAVAQYWRNQQRAVYHELDDYFANNADALYDNDPLYNEVLRYLDEVDAVSISLLQRKFKIGYNRSARIIDMLESQGRIMPAQGSKVRKVIR